VGIVRGQEELQMKTIKTVAKYVMIVYLLLSLVASVAVNLGCYDVLSFKGCLTVIEYQPPYDEYGAMIYQYSPFCNACDVYLWLIEFEPDGGIRCASDGFDCFGMYWFN
jgi:hypothetical protein